MTPIETRRTPALTTHERDLGLHRVVVSTSLGRIVVRAGRTSSDTEHAADRRATILLHGAAGSWTTWTPLVAASDRMANPLRDLIIPDLPGWGESRDFPEGAGIGDLSDAVAEIAQALGYSSWRIVGHSLGGFIALDIAARHPQSTTSVALVSASGAGVLDAVRRPLRGGLRLPGFAGMLLAMRLLAAFGHGGRGFVRALDRIGLLRALSAPLFARPAAVHRSVITAIGDEVRPVTFRRAATLAAAYDTDAWRGITCPVGSVRGDADVFTGTRDAAAFAALIPGFCEVILPDAGHFAHVERPAAVFSVMSAVAGLRRPITSRPKGAAARVEIARAA